MPAFLLADNSAEAFQSDALPFTGPELTDFNSTVFLLLTFLGDDAVPPRLPTDTEFLLGGTITSLDSQTVVPLPAGIWLLGSGLVMLAISRRRYR